ncbi:AbrB/MazE/SpoVT family DNA-binding domain-containing protein [Agrobacterium vitis]|uniref:AbrB/MazE/SpoVT family DNA-binding domain-containing protein n=1 Tax=Agrobacterium vitis TaxID=373 RepID=UPI0015717D28|nr:type II toxin-antitoxin system PrlF family antitoxin [Agrobacterium vitis]NSZ17711.1 AbrB/MazE/SpoVT family DNA-binding domain-containing protein [Agrobacterium vitis]QZO03390.1 type II toxin-antitoxin system PrlF family antitoxin [Agrobacterium vitis]UJL88511.1 type II toxin-antitoxin system PrlF family antitoxin [Agrobacterium vitis]
MNIFYATMTSKGQTTVPAEIRELLKLKPGDRIRYVVKNGEVTLKAKNKRLIDLAGILHRPGMPTLTIEEMDETIGDAIVDHVMGRE